MLIALTWDAREAIRSLEIRLRQPTVRWWATACRTPCSITFNIFLPLKWSSLPQSKLKLKAFFSHTKKLDLHDSSHSSRGKVNRLSTFELKFGYDSFICQPFQPQTQTPTLNPKPKTFSPPHLFNPNPLPLTPNSRPQNNQSQRAINWISAYDWLKIW